MDDQRKQELEKQGYRIVGNHSAIKICMWTKKAIKAEDVCYKKAFYGIETHRCVQMTPCLPFCTMRCLWCWRDSNFNGAKWNTDIDEPKDIVDGCIKEQVKILQGFKGNSNADPKTLDEAFMPNMFAISLVGEPTLYPKLPDLIDEIRRRNMTAFLVTNGTNPFMLEILKGHEPTQLYITLPAPNKDVYEKVCNPVIPNGWDNIMQSLSNLEKLDTRRTIRLTLVKGVNMINAHEYANILKQHPDIHFIEAKGYVWVGHSRERLEKDSMPTHEDIKAFANEIIKHYPELKIIAEKENSRVVLLAKQDYDWRVMNS